MRLARLSLVLIVLATTPVLAGLPTVQYEGHAYVELERIAQILGARLDVGNDATRTSIRTPRNVVTFTRNWAQILVDGRGDTPLGHEVVVASHGQRKRSGAGSQRKIAR